MNCFSQDQLARITSLIREIEKLSDVEKLFLYLQLPCGRADELPQGAIGNGLNGKASRLNGYSGGNRTGQSELFTKPKPDQETTQTYTWILSHLEEDSNVSLPKQEVYEEYKAFCQANRFEPFCVADFGKAMKHSFPCIKPRRLGQRGNSRYCYSGLRKKYKIQPPNLPDMIEPTFCMENDCSGAYSQVIKDCRDNPQECVLNKQGKMQKMGYEAMDLKIESGDHQNNPTNGYSNHCNNGTNTTSTDRSHDGGFNVNQSRLVKQETTHASVLSSGHDKPTNQPTTINHQPQGPIATNYLIHSSTPITHPQPAAQPIHQPNQSHPPPTHQDQQRHPPPPSQPCTRYPSHYSTDCMLQRSGTPDDDDYRHNYLGSRPMDQPLTLPMQCPNMIFNVSQPLHHSINDSLYQQHQPQHSHLHHQHQVDTSSGHRGEQNGPLVGSEQSASTSAPDHGALNQQQHHSNQTSEFSSSCGSSSCSTSSACSGTGGSSANPSIVSAAPSSTVSTPTTTSTIHHLMHVHNIRSPIIDTYASPFQSPAPTPFPMSSGTGGGYLVQDMSDYYLNDFQRFVD